MQVAAHRDPGPPGVLLGWAAAIGRTRRKETSVVADESNVNTLDNLLAEDRTFAPPAEFAATANVGARPTHGPRPIPRRSGPNRPVG